jgi:hypothetical protein
MATPLLYFFNLGNMCELYVIVSVQIFRVILLVVARELGDISYYISSEIDLHAIKHFGILEFNSVCIHHLMCFDHFFLNHSSWNHKQNLVSVDTIDN